MNTRKKRENQDKKTTRPIAAEITRLSCLVLLSRESGELIRELLQWVDWELGLLPEVRCEEGVGVSDSGEGGLEGVLKGLGGTGGGGVDIVDTSELEKTLDGWGGDETSTTGSWDKLLIPILAHCFHITPYEANRAYDAEKTYSDSDGSALSGLLSGQRVRLSERVTPVSTTDWKDAQLGDNDSSSDSSGDFLGSLDTETDVSIGITNDDDSLEAGTLTGTGLLLDWLDL